MVVILTKFRVLDKGMDLDHTRTGFPPFVDCLSVLNKCWPTVVHSEWCLCDLTVCMFSGTFNALLFS